MKSPKNKPKSPKKKQKRRRKLPYVFTGDYHLEEELFQLLHAGDQSLRVYVYRAKDRCIVKPWIIKCRPYEGLLGGIRDEFGSGEYAIIIAGETMKFAGIIGVETPIGWVPPS